MKPNHAKTNTKLWVDCLGSARITKGEHSHSANQEYDDSEALAGSLARIMPQRHQLKRPQGCHKGKMSSGRPQAVTLNGSLKSLPSWALTNSSFSKGLAAYLPVQAMVGTEGKHQKQHAERHHAKRMLLAKTPGYTYTSDSNGATGEVNGELLQCLEQLS